MKTLTKCFRWLAIGWLGALCGAACGADAVFRITPDRSNAVYRCGEEAVFTIDVCDSNRQAFTAGVVSVTCTRDGYAGVSTNVFQLSPTAPPPYRVAATLATPGFLHCGVRLAGPRGAALGNAWRAVGFEPDKIQPVTPCPADFKEWWDAQRRKLASVPLDVHLDKIEGCSGEWATGYRFSVASANGERVHGFLAVPTEKGHKGPYPALVNFPGAGPGFAGPTMGSAQMGRLTLNLNVHKYAVPTNGAQQALETYEKKLRSRSYLLEGCEDPETYHFYTIFLGFDRALDYLMSRPDWDGKRLVVSGASQGGWLALVMAGMKNDKVTAAAAGVPFMSDLGRRCWHGGPSLNNGLLDKGSRTIPYYAGVNFARFVTCPVIVSVGYRDSSCYPASVYAAYNVIPSADKTLYVSPVAGHALTDEYREAEGLFITKHLRH